MEKAIIGRKNEIGKTETFYNIIPSYCLLHLTWRIK